MDKKGTFEELKIGDLVEKIQHPGGSRMAIVTELSVENYYEFNEWIKIVYADSHGGYEWVHREGLRILVDV